MPELHEYAHDRRLYLKPREDGLGRISFDLVDTLGNYFDLAFALTPEGELSRQRIPPEHAHRAGLKLNQRGEVKLLGEE